MNTATSSVPVTSLSRLGSRSSWHLRREDLPAIEEGRVALFGDHKPADSLIGVETLSRPEYLIEVEAIAVIEGKGGT